MTTQLLTFSANQQASSDKKFCCNLQHTCNISLLTKPLERDYHQALKRDVANCNRVATDRSSEIKAIITRVLQVGAQSMTATGGGRLKLITIGNTTLKLSQGGNPHARPNQP